MALSSTLSEIDSSPYKGNAKKVMIFAFSLLIQSELYRIALLILQNYGQIITFYSYKGGVGRSRAVANVAYQLARKYSKSTNKLKNILCIDFDLEAPGLYKFFQSSCTNYDPINQYGLLDIFCDYRDYLLLNSPYCLFPEWKNAIVSLKFLEPNQSDSSFTIDFIGPGKQDSSYGNRLAEFDWNNFYDKWFGGNFLEHIRKELMNNYDFVLIDSRTGESDIGGICTIQLPTLLTVIFTSSPQSTNGLEKIIDSIQKQYKSIRNGAKLPIVPFPSKIDRSVEVESYGRWFQNLVKGKLGNLMKELVGDKNVENKFNEIMTLYYPYYTFNDALESERENINESAANALRYNNFIKLIENLIPKQLFLLNENVDNIIEHNYNITETLYPNANVDNIIEYKDSIAVTLYPKNKPKQDLIQVNDNFVDNLNDFSEYQADIPDFERYLKGQKREIENIENIVNTNPK